MKPAFIWSPKPSRNRINYVYFRKELKLSSIPSRASFSLFAQTNYQLTVNGHFVGYGPARAYLEFPEFDTYDLKPYLSKGENVIGVLVAHVGVDTFHYRYAPGAFAGWGEVRVGKRRILPLSTDSGWLCHTSLAHRSDTPGFSFAIGPLQIYDERKAPRGWDSPGQSPGRWVKPESVDSSIWGRLRPRSIPSLTQDEFVAKELLGVYPHRDDERLISILKVQSPSEARHRSVRSRGFAYTYIYSERKQTVTVGCWWGEHFLNGKLLKPTPDSKLFFRQKCCFRLKQGWNFLVVSCGYTNFIWNLCLGVPRKAGLTFATDRKMSGKEQFKIAGPFFEDEAERLLSECSATSPAKMPSLYKQWKSCPIPRIPESPACALGWARFGKDLSLPPGKTSEVRVEAGSATSLVFDLGAISLGRIFVEFSAPSGTVVDVGYAEEMRHGRPWLDKNFIVSSAERHIGAGGDSRFETFQPRGCRFLQVSVSNHTEEVTIRKVGIVSQVYPYQDEGAFSCSDPFFNTVWEYGWRTLRLCSEDVITDCPWRERTLYGGDLLAEAATTFIGSGDTRLVKRCLELFMQSQNPATGWLQSRAPAERNLGTLYDYPLIVLLLVEWYCRLTGDRKFARRCYPVLRKMMRQCEKMHDEDGVYSADHRPFIEHHFNGESGKSCVVNALASSSYLAWSRLLEMLGKKQESAQALDLSVAAAQVVNELFWDEKEQAFVDHLDKTRRKKTTMLASNAWALLFGDISAEQTQGVVALIRKLMADFSPYEEAKSISSYGSFYMLAALYKAGEDILAEECMRQIYSEMIAHPTGTIWEHCQPTKSLVHAWSTAANYYLSTRALGVRMGFPESLSLDCVVIAPQSGTLSWAEGKVPHPLGVVEVSWRIKGEKLLLSYSAPAGIKVKVRPEGRLAQYELVIITKK